MTKGLDEDDAAMLRAMSERLDRSVESGIDVAAIQEMSAQLRKMRDKLEAPDWDAALKAWAGKGD